MFDKVQSIVRKPKQEPVCVTGVWLKNLGDEIIVSVEVDGAWVDVITEYVGRMEFAVSHIVEPLGIRKKIE